MTEMRSDNGKKIVRNVVYGFSTWIFPLAFSFAATPVIFRSLGDADFGIYALVLGFIAYSFNFNVGRAITKYVAEYRASGESDKIRSVISATLTINLLVGGFGCLLVFLLAGPLVRNVLRIPPESQEKTIYALYLAGLTMFFLMLGQVFTAVLQGIHRFDLYAKIFNLNNIVLISGNLGLALLGYGLLPLLGWNLVITAASALVAALIARQALPEFSFRIGFNREMLALVFGYSAWIIAYQIIANVLLLFERGWITGRLGAESLTQYVLPMTLALYIHSFIGSLMLVVFPLASELTNDREKLLRLYQKANKIACFLAVFFSATLIVESRAFLTAWIGADFAAKSAELLVVHAVTFGLLAASIVAWQLTEGLGYPNYNCLLFMICFTISISGMVGLISDFGNFGVAIARLAGFSTVFMSVFWIERRFFGRIQVGFWLRLFGRLAVAVALAVLTEKTVSGFFEPGWPSLFVTVGAGGLVYCAAAWMVGFVAADELALVKRLLGK